MFPDVLERESWEREQGRETHIARHANTIPPHYSFCVNFWRERERKSEERLSEGRLEKDQEKERNKARTSFV